MSCRSRCKGTDHQAALPPRPVGRVAALYLCWLQCDFFDRPGLWPGCDPAARHETPVTTMRVPRIVAASPERDNLRGLPFEVGRPIVHQAAPTLEEITARISCLGGVLDRRGERGLDHFAGCTRPFRGPVPEARPEPMRHGAMPSSLISWLSVASESSFPRGFGEYGDHVGDHNSPMMNIGH